MELDSGHDCSPKEEGIPTPLTAAHTSTFRLQKDNIEITHAVDDGIIPSLIRTALHNSKSEKQCMYFIEWFSKSRRDLDAQTIKISIQ